MRPGSAIALAALAATAPPACSWGEPPAPSVTAVTTGATPVLRGSKVLVTVRGAGFEPEVRADFDDPDRSRTCTPYRVELRAPGQAPVALRDVWIVSGGELRARLEGDAVKATWDLAVVDRRGREAVLPAALAVENCGNPAVACDDGESCTVSDSCQGASTCSPGTVRADGAPCSFPCTGDGTVAGTCSAGACRPLPGACDLPAACAP